MIAVNEIITYLQERSTSLSSEADNLQLSYDHLPPWAWDRLDSISSEQRKIGSMVERLRSIQ